MKRPTISAKNLKYLKKISGFYDFLTIEISREFLKIPGIQDFVKFRVYNSRDSGFFLVTAFQSLGFMRNPRDLGFFPSGYPEDRPFSWDGISRQKANSGYNLSHLPI